MNRVETTPYDVHFGHADEYEGLGVPDRINETPGFEVANHTLDKPWFPDFIKPGKEDPVPPTV